MKVLVLGCGLVGQAMVKDLAARGDLSLTVVDHDEQALASVADLPQVTTLTQDLLVSGQAQKLAADQDFVVGAVPGWMGFRVLKEVLEAGKPAADISFMPEDPYLLDELAQARGVPAIVDCGVAPGTSNFLVGRGVAALDEVERIQILVGGLPVVRRLPYEYAVVFSPADVLEEYTRPAFIVENGQELVRQALSELELVDVPGVGTLEAFLTDGLRTLRRTVQAPFMKEKTLRYPGHCERMRLLVETGLLSTTPLQVGGVEVTPRDVTAELLRRAWQLGPAEEDLTVMHVEVEGRAEGQACRHTFDLVDVFDDEEGVTSMARTTGYACTAMVDLFAAGLIKGQGIIAPEVLGRDEAVADRFLGYLEARNIRIAQCLLVGDELEA
jgi:saccharopine dehydrogenase-like NADP-dependent oxidoreductase